MKRKVLLIGALFSLGSIFFTLAATQAQSIRTGNSTTIAKQETVDSTLVATGNSIVIAGTVNGDLYCAAQNVTITGTVRGDVICAGQTVTIEGEIDGSVRVAGQQVNLGGKVTRNATLLGQEVRTANGSSVTGDAVVMAAETTLDGTVGRDLGVTASNARLNGSVGRNLSGQAEILGLGGTAIVKGSVDYTSRNDLTKESSTNIGGEVRRRDPPQEPSRTKLLAFQSAVAFYLFISLLLVSLVLVVLFPRLFRRSAEQLTTHIGQSALFGTGLIFGGPMVLVILAATVVGLPLSGIALLAWLLVLSLSGPVTGYFIGSRILQGTKYNSSFLYMLVGGGLLLLLYIIPIVNFFALLFAGIVGSGAIVRVALDQQEHQAPTKKSKHS